MTDRNLLSEQDFRDEFRAFLAQHYPAVWRQDSLRPFRRLRGNEARSWLQTLHMNGWRAPAWPRAHGGMELSFAKQMIYHEELEHAHVARIIDLGETQLGPVLMAHGTALQQSNFLPRILDCQDIWCQGYSEPGAGSDLANLRTSAVRVGDDFVLNGQKIWTTHADDSSHIFLLVRTGKFDRKQQGISFLLVDLATPGITIRPIQTLAGDADFCEVFFENVRVPTDSLVGQEHCGWTVAKALLGYERVWLGSPTLCARALELATSIAHRSGKLQDSFLATRLAELTADMHDHRQLYKRYCDRISQSGTPGSEVSVLKINASELLCRLTEFCLELLDEAGGRLGEFGLNGLDIDPHWQFMMARPTTIFGGSNEIQRNILAKTVLNLPAE